MNRAELEFFHEDTADANLYCYFGGHKPPPEEDGVYEAISATDPSWLEHLRSSAAKAAGAMVTTAAGAAVAMDAGFVTKDSGARVDLANGMVRDTEDAKDDFTLALDGPMFERWVGLLNRGARKYRPRNWMKAITAPPGDARDETKDRFKRSALRHMVQWLRGDTDEDHAAAVFFNINGYEAMGGAQ